MRRLACILGISFLLASAQAQEAGIVFFEGDWNTLLVAAEKLDQPIFLDAYTDWCAPCKKMDRLVFPDPEVGAFFNQNFLNYRMDMEKGKGKEIRKKYSVNAFPQFLFLSPQGEVIHKTTGYRTAPRLIAEGKKALPKPETIEDFKRQYDSGIRETEFLYNYLHALQKADQPTAEIFAEYIQLQKEASEDHLADRNLTLVYKQVRSLESPEYQYLSENYAIFEAFFGASAMDTKLNWLIDLQALKAGRSSNADRLKPIDQAIAVHFPDTTSRVKQRAELVYQRARKDWNAFNQLAEVYVDSWLLEAPKAIDLVELERIAGLINQHSSDKEMLGKAEKWITTSIRIDVSYSKLLLRAELLHKIGKTRKARQTAEDAIQLAGIDQDDPEEAKALLEKINAK